MSTLCSLTTTNHTWSCSSRHPLCKRSRCNTLDGCILRTPLSWLLYPEEGGGRGNRTISMPQFRLLDAARQGVRRQSRQPTDLRSLKQLAGAHVQLTNDKNKMPIDLSLEKVGGKIVEDNKLHNRSQQTQAALPFSTRMIKVLLRTGQRTSSSCTRRLQWLQATKRRTNRSYGGYLSDKTEARGGEQVIVTLPTPTPCMTWRKLCVHLRSRVALNRLTASTTCPRLNRPCTGCTQYWDARLQSWLAKDREPGQMGC